MKKTKKEKLLLRFTAGFMVLFMGLWFAGSKNFETNFYQATSTSVEASLFNKGVSGINDEIQKSYNTQPVSLVPLGTAFGVKLYTDGVIVTSLATIATDQGSLCPAGVAGIKEGDYILAVNGEDISSNTDFMEKMSKITKLPATITVRRGTKVFDTQLTPVSDSGVLKCGMWIRDSAAGIGTLTYYNPADGTFAGLGHGICDIDTKTVMSLKTGEPAEIAITGIIQGQKGNPGRLCGYFTNDETLGNLTANCDTGIYGTLNYVPQGEAIPIGYSDEVQKGAAEIIATIDDSGPHHYSISIDKISDKNQKIKNLVIKVTDPELLEKTGGIIQGMSGCPIIQNGKLIGAVTHVFVDDPKSGYGIFIENMLSQ